jgi:DNA repair protein RecO (recombination protein O)
MIVNTRGIVLHHLNYSETSIIAKIYTEQFGLQSFLVRGVRQKKSRMRMNLFGPLSMVEMVMVYKEKTTLHHLREINSAYPGTGIATDMRRTSLAIFINELLYKSIHGEEPDAALFTFIEDSIKYLDATCDRLAFFHMKFAVELTHFLGFSPHDNYSPQNRFFDLQEGAFVSAPPQHPYYLDESLSVHWHQLLAQQIPDDWPPALRDTMLLRILDYYRLHLPEFREMKSHEILREVMH